MGMDDLVQMLLYRKKVAKLTSHGNADLCQCIWQIMKPLEILRWLLEKYEGAKSVTEFRHLRNHVFANFATSVTIDFDRDMPQKTWISPKAEPSLGFGRGISSPWLTRFEAQVGPQLAIESIWIPAQVASRPRL